MWSGPDSSMWSGPGVMWSRPDVMWSGPDIIWSRPDIMWSGPDIMWSRPDISGLDQIRIYFKKNLFRCRLWATVDYR